MAACKHMIKYFFQTSQDIRMHGPHHRLWFFDVWIAVEVNITKAFKFELWPQWPPELNATCIVRFTTAWLKLIHDNAGSDARCQSRSRDKNADQDRSSYVIAIDNCPRQLVDYRHPGASTRRFLTSYRILALPSTLSLEARLEGFGGDHVDSAIDANNCCDDTNIQSVGVY